MKNQTDIFRRGYSTRMGIVWKSKIPHELFECSFDLWMKLESLPSSSEVYLCSKGLKLFRKLADNREIKVGVDPIALVIAVSYTHLTLPT